MPSVRKMKIQGELLPCANLIYQDLDRIDAFWHLVVHKWRWEDVGFSFKAEDKILHTTKRLDENAIIQGGLKRKAHSHTFPAAYPVPFQHAVCT